MTGYRYPDPHDRVPGNGIRHEGTPGSWPAADRDLVRAAARRLPARPRSALDVGCGTGRLLETIAAEAGSVVGIDPDAHRLAGARHDAPDAAVRIVHTDVVSYARERPRAELVVCSHVLQHVRTRDRAPFLAALRDVTDPAGILLLTWSSSSQQQGRHLLSRPDGPGDGVVTTEVGAGVFDRGVDASDGALPVWHAGVGEVEQLTRRAGFTVVESDAYRHFTFESSVVGGAGPVERAASDRYLLATVRGGGQA